VQAFAGVGMIVEIPGTDHDEETEHHAAAAPRYAA
jgi:hypothetical protein